MATEDLVAEVSSKDPAVGLAAVAALRRLLVDLERAQVDSARDQGWSWGDIAGVLGVSKQSVHEKHRPRRTALGKED